MKKNKIYLAILFYFCFLNSTLWAAPNSLITRISPERIMNVLENIYWEKKTNGEKIAYVYCATDCIRCVDFEKLIQKNSYGIEFRFFYTEDKDLSSQSNPKFSYNMLAKQEVYQIANFKGSYTTPILFAPIAGGNIIAQVDSKNIAEIANLITPYITTERFDKEAFIGTAVLTKNNLPSLRKYVSYGKNTITVYLFPNKLSPDILSIKRGQYADIVGGAVITEPGWIQVSVPGKSAPGYLYDPVFASVCGKDYITSPANDIFYARVNTEVKNIPAIEGETIHILRQNHGMRKRSIITDIQTGRKFFEVQSDKTIGYIPFY